MCSFLPVYIEVTVCKYRTSYRAYAYGFFGKVHLFNYLGYEFVYHSVRTTGTVVHGGIVYEWGLAVNEVLWLYYFFSCHDSFILSAKIFYIAFLRLYVSINLRLIWEENG